MSGAKLLIFSGEDPNMRYATGLDLPDPFIYISSDEKEFVLVNKIEFSRAKKLAKKGIQVILWDTVEMDNIRLPKHRKKNLADMAASFLLAHNLSELLVAENCWALHLESLREHNLRVRMLRPFFPERLLKTPSEIKSIKKAGLAAKAAMQRAVDIIKESTIQWDDSLLYHDQKITSEFVKREIERILSEQNAICPDVIVSCGEDSAEPHNRGTGELKAGKPIVIDIFPRDRVSGYHFDMTRTLIKGTPSPELKKLFQTVKRAQDAALAVIAPGSAKGVHDSVIDVFTKADFDTTNEEGFIHSTGHGLGLAVHEPPRLGANSEDTLLAGMVVTVEPGLYYLGLGGVRIEDTVLITKNGCQNLTNFPKMLLVK
ncbi:aminopeptidase P family protein [Candidatus Woesearchaeota archaeon]|nr:aminopeptidase P family protein [Candidatus Woesearchaeota archaeon]